MNRVTSPVSAVIKSHEPRLRERAVDVASPYTHTCTGGRPGNPPPPLARLSHTPHESAQLDQCPLGVLGQCLELNLLSQKKNFKLFGLPFGVSIIKFKLFYLGYWGRELRHRPGTKQALDL